MMEVLTMRRWGIVLILIGLCVIAFPQFKHVYEDVEQRKLLASLNQISSEIPDSSEALIQKQLQLVYQDFSVNGDTSGLASSPIHSAQSVTGSLNTSISAPETISEREGSENPDAQAYDKKKSNTEAIGIVEIPKINVKLPILQGASSANLNRGAAHLTGTAMLGGSGNAVVAAHHSYKYGRMFNRLGEITKGDTITIQTGKQIFSYKVTGTKTVKPNDVSVLNQPQKGQYLTLITCDNDGSHRIIVKAEIQ
jgi:sortase A